jgi:hypothetical protein
MIAMICMMIMTNRHHKNHLQKKPLFRKPIRFLKPYRFAVQLRLSRCKHRCQRSLFTLAIVEDFDKRKNAVNFLSMIAMICMMIMTNRHHKNHDHHKNHLQKKPLFQKPIRFLKPYRFAPCQLSSTVAEIFLFYSQ